jgi:long-subunit fatty acid transport protein
MDTVASAPEGFSDDESKDRQIYQFGLQYKPIPNVVIKADYRNFTAKKGSLPDDFNLGLGFIF